MSTDNLSNLDSPKKFTSSSYNLSLQVQNLATTILKRSYSTGSVYKVLSEVSNIDNNESIKFDSLELRAISPDFIEWFIGFVWLR